MQEKEIYSSANKICNALNNMPFYNVGIDDSPLDTDWNSFNDLWNDIRKFAKDNPDCEIMWADNPGRLRMGLCAYKSNEWNPKIIKEWTISINNLGEIHNTVRCALQTLEGKLNLLKSLKTE